MLKSSSDKDDAFANWVRMRHIREMLAIARLGSISGAANALNLTQPAVSKTLAEVEAELDTRLFNRTSHGLAQRKRAKRYCVIAERLNLSCAKRMKIYER